MKRVAFFLLVLLLFSISLYSYGDPLSPSFRGNFDVETMEDLWELIYPPLLDLYPSMEGFTSVEGSLHDYDGMLYLYARGTYLYLNVLPIAPEEMHLFVHFKEDGGAELATILAWDDGGFAPAPLRDPISLNTYLFVEALSFDEEVMGVGIQGILGAAAGRIGEYTLYRYRQGQGYERIWSALTPSVEVVAGSPLELVVIEYIEWDETFPFYDLSNYCQICLGLFSRKMGATYRWEREKNTLIQGEEKELYDHFTIVNHFLKAILEDDRERAASLSTEDLIGRLFEIPLSFLTTTPLYLYPDIHEWAHRVGYEGEGPFVNILLSRTEEGGLNLQEEEIEAVLLFAFDNAEPPLVRDIFYYHFKEQ